MSAPRLTVAIPLFHSARWRDSIVENIRRIPEDAIIVLSDEISSDDTAQWIAARMPGDPRLRVRLRHGESGFQQHCNALIAECDTELFSLLPHDDLVAPRYYEELIAALDREPAAGIAFGRIIDDKKSKAPTPLRGLPQWTGTFEPWLEAILLASSWSLGIAFRGVIRRQILRAMPAPTPGYAPVDELWVFSMALSTRLLEVPSAIYHKRYYPTSTHVAKEWTLSLAEEKTRLSAVIREVLGDNDAGSRAQIFLEASWHNRLYDSRAWRWTARLRAVARFLRRTRISFFWHGFFPKFARHSRTHPEMQRSRSG